MDFKEKYKKYLAGTATNEEKVFVESEIEKARMVNSEVLAASAIPVQSDEEKLKYKKKKKIKQTIKIIWISAVVFSVIALIAFGTVFYMTTTSAEANINVTAEEAKELALEKAFEEAKYHKGYSGTVDDINSTDINTRELVFMIPFNKCHYVYEFDFIVGDMEMEIEVNAKTGMCTITDIDRD